MMPKGENHYNWQGGTRKRHNGYIAIMCPDHPRADKKGYVLSHVLKAEKALGKHLPDKAVIHHHSIDQLVICENQAYHLLLHQRTRALKASGHANWLRCKYCKQYAPASELNTEGNHYYCCNEYRKQKGYGRIKRND